MKNIESNNYENNSSSYQSRNNYSANFVGKSENNIKFQHSPPQINSKQVETKNKRDTKATQVSEFVTKFVAIISAAAIGVAGVGALSPFSTKYQVFMDDCYASQNEIYYNIYIENKEIDNNQAEKFEFLDEFTVVLHNDFTNREEKFVDNYAEGVFENLQTNMTYTLSVKIGNKTIATKTLKTFTRTSDGQNGNAPYTEPNDPTQGDNTGQYDPTRPNSNEGDLTNG